MFVLGTGRYVDALPSINKSSSGSHARLHNPSCSLCQKSNNDLPHSSTHVQVLSCHLIYSPYSLYQLFGHFKLMTSLSSSISGGLWAKFIFYFVALHHVMCMRTKYLGVIVKPLMFPPTSDSRSGSVILVLYISQRRL